METVQLLQASVDEDEESHFRLLCPGNLIKYITIAAGTYAADDMCFAPTLIQILPAFPPGDWNDGYVARNPTNGTPYFTRAAKTQFPGIRSAWHPTYLDCLELEYGAKLRSGVYEATSPRFQSAVVVKFARFAWEIDALERECAAYQWIENQDIGPRFLGNLTEGGRIIGFVMAKIADARHASPTDFALCEKKLSGLHKLHIVHGDINKYNFLIAGGQATLVDFDTARKSCLTIELENELRSLGEHLNDTSGRGGSFVVDNASS